MKMNRRAVLKAGVASVVAASTHGKANAESDDKSSVRQPSVQTVPLADHPITHGGVQTVRHARLNADVHGQTCIRYLRFGRPVELDRLELGALVYGRATPHVPTHPAHITVSTLDPEQCRWILKYNVQLPANPAIEGAGLNQSMSADDMEAHFRKCLEEPPVIIQLDGLRTDHLRVVCLSEHPVWPNHGECNGGPHNVPFGILNSLRVHGVAHGDVRKLEQPPRLLRQRGISPKAPKGMKVSTPPGAIVYRGPRLEIGFSLRRPMLMHLGWDILGDGQARNNRLLVSRRGQTHNVTGGVSGPILRTLAADYPPSLWTGEISVEGNRVTYSNLQTVDGLTISAMFTIERDKVILKLRQVCDSDMPVIEAEAWRWAWDLTQGITGMVGMPTLNPGRNGDVMLPALWATDGVGCMSFRQTDSSYQGTRMQVESYREGNCVTGGVVFGRHASPDECQVIPAGDYEAEFELELADLEPQHGLRSRKPDAALRRHWPTVFSCFRPEHRGFSNHSASVNCHLSQGPPIEIVTHTQRPKYGPNPLDLARFTVGRALMDGGGYGYFRNLYLDSDPVLLSAAGSIHRAEPDSGWLCGVVPGIAETVERMLNAIGPEGLVVCRDLSGNYGSYRWSSNSMDVVGFGHIDGYVNAWAYRGFRNAAALLEDAGERTELVARCRESAARLRESYGKALLNPETGWVAGWRSRDGVLHDYGFTWVNGVALAFGLLDLKPARQALDNLERARLELGPSSAELGLPCNLLPIRQDDQMWSKIVKQLQPTFETYTDGSLSGWPATYYLRALATYGPGGSARQLAEELARGYEGGVFNGGNGSGSEFRSWEGLPTGYEGTLIGCFGPLYGIAIEKGSLIPRTPEWWPANG